MATHPQYETLLNKKLSANRSRIIFCQLKNRRRATTVIEDKESRVEEMKERGLQRDIGGFGVKWEQWQQ